MRFSVASREVFWRWFGLIRLADGPTLLLSGDVARWILMGWSGKALYAYRLAAREAMYERDFEAIAELEQFHYASEHEVVALWRCTACGRVYGANR